MFMFRIVEMRASRRFTPILLEAGILNLFQPNARGVEADHGVLADLLEEIPSILLSRSMTILIGQSVEHLDLLIGGDLEKTPPEQIAGVRINPPDSIPKAVLEARI